MEEPRPKKLLDQVRACPELAEGMPFASRGVAGQCKHYSNRTEQAYVGWTRMRTSRS
jgi:hypothetical protein